MGLAIRYCDRALGEARNSKKLIKDIVMQAACDLVSAQSEGTKKWPEISV